MNDQIKNKNVIELERFTQRATSAIYNDIIISHPTPYSKGEIPNKGNNINDIIIEDDALSRMETVDLGALFINENITEQDVTGMFHFLIHTDDMHNISFIDDEGNSHEFTVPNYTLNNTFNSMSDGGKKNLIWLIMIGVNDNGRYRNYRGDAGFNNHMYTALAAYHLVNASSENVVKINLRNKGITNLAELKKWLYSGNIINRDYFV